MTRYTYSGLTAVVGDRTREDVDVLARRLDRVGHAVVAKASVPTLINDAVRELNPDVVVLGQYVGTTSGLAVARRVGEMKRLPVIQVVDSFDAAHHAPESPSEVFFVGRDASDAEWSIRIERALDLCRLHESLRGRVDHLKRRLDHARLIARAKRHLMDELGLDEESAYGKLRRASQDQRIPLERVADEVLSTGVTVVLERSRTR